ncbi:MAG: S41 family peptidase, partial [Alphaproteobacteria bacterium]|nr:S41 family peptidase [Alphaproteobacteria bacterium]
MSKIKKTIFKNIFVFSFVYLINSNNIIVAAEQDKSLKSFFYKNVLTSQKTTENDQTPFKDDPSLKLIADVLPTALSILQVYYIDQPNFQNICFNGIKRILEKDDSFTFIVDQNKITLSKDGKIIDTYSILQPQDDLKYWIVTSLNVLNRAFEHSPKLYTITPEKILSYYMKGAAGSLDELTRYVPPHKSIPEHQIYIGNIKVEESEATSWSQVYNNVLYLRIKHFEPWTSNEVVSLLKGAKDKHEGIILDLRDNVGGRLEQAIEIADAFLDKGLLATSKGRHQDSYQKFEANGQRAVFNNPLILLVNQKSASAAEVLTAALKENDRALILGRKTYGKGSIQRVQGLPNDGSLVFTWASLYTPLGHRLNKVGIDPFLSIEKLNPAQLIWLKNLIKTGIAPQKLTNTSYMTGKSINPATLEKDELDLALSILSNKEF